MKNKTPPPSIAVMYFDKYGISFTECPKCVLYIPNVSEGEKTCSFCGWKFRIIKKVVLP